MYKTRKQIPSRRLRIESETDMIEYDTMEVDPETEPETMSIQKEPVQENVLDEEGCTPLMNLCIQGDLTLIRESIHDLNYQDEDGWTALMYAAYHNQPETVSLLLQSKANPYLKTNNGKNARWLSYTEGHIHVVRILDEHTQGTK